jgi:hypothetical protein
MKKIILILLMVFGIAGIAQAEWFSWLYIDWGETRAGNYSISIKVTRLDGSVPREYVADLGDRNKFKLDVDPKGIHLIKVYSDGEKMFEMTYISESFANSLSGDTLTF